MPIARITGTMLQGFLHPISILHEPDDFITTEISHKLLKDMNNNDPFIVTEAP